MKFSEPVKMDYLKKNDTFYKLFRIFYRDINYKDNQMDWPLEQFEVDHWGW